MKIRKIWCWIWEPRFQESSHRYQRLKRRIKWPLQRWTSRVDERALKYRKGRWTFNAVWSMEYHRAIISYIMSIRCWCGMSISMSVASFCTFGGSVCHQNWSIANFCRKWSSAYFALITIRLGKRACVRVEDSMFESSSSLLSICAHQPTAFENDHEKRKGYETCAAVAIRHVVRVVGQKRHALGRGTPLLVITG